MPFVHARKTGIVVIALADFGHSPTLTPYESTSEHSHGKLDDNPLKALLWANGGMDETRTRDLLRDRQAF